MNFGKKQRKKPMKQNYRKVCMSLLCATLLAAPSLTVRAAETANHDYTFDEFVVTATRTEKARKDVASSISVINREMIERSNAKNIGDLLARLPGVSVNNATGGFGGGGAISMRGFNGGGGSSKVLFLLDGRPMSRSFNGGLDLNIISLQNIERIEVVRGPASALYGDSALSGTINIITKKADKDSTSITVNYGSFGTVDTTLLKEGKDGKISYQFAGNYGHSSGFKPNSDYEESNFTFRMDVGDDWIVRAGTTHDNRTSPQADLPRGVSLTNSYRANMMNVDNTYFDVEKKFTAGNTRSSFRIYDNENKSRKINIGAVTPDNWLEDTAKGMQWQQDVVLSDKQTVTWGAEYRWLSATNLINNQAFSGAQTYALYIQNDQSLSEKWNVNLGGRYDHHSVYGGQFSPKFGLVYKMQPDTALKLNVAKAFKAPTLGDLYGTNGNPNLKPTTLWSYEIGIEKQFNPTTRGSFVLYKMNSTNNIIKGTNITSSNANVNPQGFEVELVRKMNKNVDFFVNYTYLDVGLMTYYATRHKANMGLTYANGPFSYSLSEAYVGSTWTDDAINADGSPKARHLLKPYFLTNLKITYDAHKDYSLSFSIDNLFNADYQVTEYYPMPGRAYTLSFSKKF